MSGYHPRNLQERNDCITLCYITTAYKCLTRYYTICYCADYEQNSWQLSGYGLIPEIKKALETAADRDMRSVSSMAEKILARLVTRKRVWEMTQEFSIIYVISNRFRISENRIFHRP